MGHRNQSDTTRRRTASSKASPGGAGHALQPLEVDRLQQHLGRIHELWDELSGYGVGQADAALRCCMERIGSWLDVQDAFWIGAVHLLKCPEQNARDSLSGWRIRAIEHLHPHFHDARHNEKVVKGGQIEDQGATNVALAAGAGRFRAYTLQAGELVDIDAFRETAHYGFYYRRWGIRDRIWVAAPVNADTESYFCFDRIGEQARLFDDGELALAAFTLRGIKWFHRQLMLSHGLGLSVAPLTHAERRVIRGLLSGATERVIAEKTGLSPGTVHQYACRIYKKFAVRGRLEFTALWLSGHGG